MHTSLVDCSNDRSRQMVLTRRCFHPFSQVRHGARGAVLSYRPQGPIFCRRGCEGAGEFTLTYPDVGPTCMWIWFWCAGRSVWGGTST
jgi:hypothetical protein